MKIRVFVSGLMAAVISLCLMAATAAAATYNVTRTDDPDNGTGNCASTDTSCSLREALNVVNAGSGGDTIAVRAGTYAISSTLGALQINKDVAIQGAGAGSTTLDGGGATQIIAISGGTVSISGVTLSHGIGSGARGGAIQNESTLTLTSDVLSANTSTGAGGAIDSEGTLTVQNSTFSGNSSHDYAGAINTEGGIGAQALNVTNTTFSGNQTGNRGGGAISVSESSGLPTVTIAKSLFTGNSTTTGGAGGAIIFGGPGTYQISDSTFTGNHADGNGGAISASNTGSILINDTLSGNSAAGDGGNFDLSGTPLPALTNTIVAGGSASPSTSANCNNHVTSNGHNLEDDATGQCGFTGPGDQINTDPKLGPLADNGGPTQTMALQAGSPAIDAGTNTGCPATDQRGVTRPQGAACDIGAYEVAPPNASTGSATNVSPTGATLNASAGNPDAVAGTVVFDYGTTTSYGSTTTAQSIAAGTGSTAFSAAVSSLQPNTTYHYRVVVTNPDGTATGSDQTFTTMPTPPAPPSNQFSIGKRHVAKNGTISIKLHSPDAGSFKGKATFKAHHKKFTYGKGSKSAGGAGNVTLKIKLTRHARKELLKLGHATVTIVIKFTPNGGKSRSKTIRLKVKVKHGHFS
jgi:predicted outer membrane repeat protein